jgi:hypothetical protein
MFTSKSSATWSSASREQLLVSRGRGPPNLLNGSVDSCQRASTPALSMSGIGDPPAGLQYPVRGWNSGGYGSPGNATAGVRTQNSAVPALIARIHRSAEGSPPSGGGLFCGARRRCGRRRRRELGAALFVAAVLVRLLFLAGTVDRISLQHLLLRRQPHLPRVRPSR